MPPTLMHDTGGNAVVRPLAERSRADGVKVISLHPFPSAPLNKGRRFLPLRFDDASVKVSWCASFVPTGRCPPNLTPYVDDPDQN